MTRVRNDQFSASRNFKRGRSVGVFALWYLVKCAFFLSALPWPSSMKCAILRIFGAKVGRRVYIKPRVNIHFPWKLTIGAHTWVGEEVNIINFENVVIGEHCCLSQRVFLCAGNHDYRSVDMAYRNAPIEVASGVWIGAQSFIGPGVRLGEECVISAGSIVCRDTLNATVYSGNPAMPTRNRWQNPVGLPHPNAGAL